VDRQTLEFRTIDVAQHMPLCVEFSEDMFRCSFGTTDRFHGSDGKGRIRYSEALYHNTLQDPSGFVHVWRGSEIIGQVELGRYSEDASIGFVYLFYVIPRCRGTGAAALLDDYAADYFRKREIYIANLLVSPANARAVRFYIKQGWQDLGPDERDTANHLMQKVYAENG
jgi:GNAT superfamily N-acetyltransferase